MTRKRVKETPPEPNPDFRAAVGDVRPIKVRRMPLPTPQPPARARFARADDAAVLDESMRGGDIGIGLESGEELNFRRPNISLQVLKQLRRGNYAIQDELDLHGMTANEARVALRAFMTEVLRHGYRCVRIVHGKGLRSGPGGPVLKVKLNKWLPQWDDVLAYVNAPRSDGGTGAIYVLLRK